MRSASKLRDEEIRERARRGLDNLSAYEHCIDFHRAEIPVRQHPHELPGLVSLDAAIPSPAMALAVAPSLMLIASWLSTRTEVTRPSLWNEKVGEGCAGLMIIEWCARSDGFVGVPRSRR